MKEFKLDIKTIFELSSMDLGELVKNKYKEGYKILMPDGSVLVEKEVINYVKEEKRGK